MRDSGSSEGGTESGQERAGPKGQGNSQYGNSQQQSNPPKKPPCVAASGSNTSRNGANSNDGNSSNGPYYWERYRNFVSDNAIDVGPYALTLLGGLWPKSLAPATGGTGPLLGSTNPLTSVPRAFGVPGSGSTIVRGGAATIGVATVGIGFYDATIELEGFVYAAPNQGSSTSSCPRTQ